MDAAKLEQLYTAHKDEAISLAVRKWGYSRDHAEDALQNAVLYLLENFKKPTLSRSGFIQNVRQQCVNLMGKNEGRSVSRGTRNKMVLVGDWRELSDVERKNTEVRAGRKLPKRSSSNHEGEWIGGGE